MKGLLKNDMLIITQDAKFYLLLGVNVMIGAVSAFFTWRIGVSNVSVLVQLMFCCLLCLIPLQLCHNHEKSGWKQYCLTLSISKKQYVSEKYLIGSVLAVGYGLISVLVLFFIGKLTDISELLMIFSSFVMIIMGCLTFLLPLAILLDAVSSMLLFLLLGGYSIIWGGMGLYDGTYYELRYGHWLFQMGPPPGPDEVIVAFESNPLYHFLPFIILAGTFFLYVLSWLIGVKLYNGRKS